MKKIMKIFVVWFFVLDAIYAQGKEFKQDSETVNKVVEEYKKVLEKTPLSVPDTIYISKEHKKAVEEGRIPPNTFKWLVNAGEVALTPVFHLIANNKNLHPITREIGIGIIGLITEKTNSKKGINYLWQIVRDTVKTGKIFMGRDWQEWAKVDAFFALAGQKDTSITKPLMEILKKEKNHGLKSEMIFGLGMRGDKRVAPYIVEILHEYKEKYPKKEWDERSMRGSGGVGGSVNLVVRRCFMALGRLKAKEYINEFLEVIQDSELTWDFRGLTIRDLSAMGKDAKDAVPVLLELLKEKDDVMPDYVLWTLITALGDIGDKRAIPVLREKLKKYKIMGDPHRVVNDCVLSLALLEDKEVIPDVTKMYEARINEREVKGYKGPVTEREKRILKALKALGLENEFKKFDRFLEKYRR